MINMGNAWRCPECETINTENKCVVCGANRPNEKEQGSNNISNNQNNIVKTERSHTSILNNNKKEHKSKKSLIWLFGITGSMVVLVVGVFIGSTFNRGRTDVVKNVNDPNTTSVSLTQMTFEPDNNAIESKTTTITTDNTKSQFTETASDSSVVVPNLTNLTESDAIDICKSLGLSYEIVKERNDIVKDGIVVSQSISAGTNTSKGTKIIVSVSNGDDSIITLSDTLLSSSASNKVESDVTTKTIQSETKAETEIININNVIKDIEIETNNSIMTDRSWKQSVTVDKTIFDISCITDKSLIKVEYTFGEPASITAIPIKLVVENDTKTEKVDPYEFNIELEKYVKLASFKYEDIVNAWGTTDLTSIKSIGIGNCNTCVQIKRITITNCSVDSNFQSKIQLSKGDFNSSSPDPKWTETEINETYYIKMDCYSRKEAVVGSDPVKKYKKGSKIEVIAATDTGYYKLIDGAYIHGDYVTEKNPDFDSGEDDVVIIVFD